MRHHVAILQKRFLMLILNGTKTIESRITRNKLAPWNCITKGDLIHLKQASGPFLATAIAGKIHSFENLTPDHLQQLKKQFNTKTFGLTSNDESDCEHNCESDQYWLKKQHCNYATFIELTHVKPTSTGPAFPKSYGLAWFVLDAPSPSNAANNSFDVTLSQGALNNHYMIAPPAIATGPVTLLLPTGRELYTHVKPNRRVASRKWTADYKNLNAGDTARFVPQGNKRYRVTFKTNTPASLNQTQ